MKTPISNFALSFLALISLAQHVHATDITWTNWDDNLTWDTSSNNWDDGEGNSLWIDGNVAVLGAVGPSTVTVSGTRTISGLTTTIAGFTLSGGTISLGSASTPFVINNLITVNSAIVGGTKGIAKSGAGTLTLGGGLANAFSGPITIDAGRLSSSSGTSLKNVTGTVTVAAGATFNAVQNFDANNIANPIVLSGTGSGYDGHGALNLQGNATLTGAITLNTDTKITHDWNSGNLNGTITGTDKNLQFTNISSGQPGMVVNGAINLGTGAITISSAAGSGYVSLNGTNTYSGGTSIGVGGLSIGKGGALGSGNVTFATNTFLRGSADLTQPNPIIINPAISATLTSANGVTLTQSGALTGSGNLTITGPGSVMLTGGLANTFSSPITVASGRFACGNGASVKNMTGTITVAAGASFDAQQGFDPNSIATNFILSGNGSGIYSHGALNVQGNATLTGSITLLADTKITHDWNNGTINGAITGTNTNLQLTTTNNGQFNLTLNGSINLGTGGVTVNGAGGTSPVTLAGTLNYTGETSVQTGTLELTGSAKLNDASTVRIATGAILKLNFSGTDTVDSLYIGGVKMEAGSYGSNTSSATHQSADFSGNGILQVGGSDYTSWAATNAGGQAASLDYDGDGVSNGVEYFMGVTAPGFTAMPRLVGNTITWPKNPAVLASYVIETSTTLADGSWIPTSAGVVDHGTSVEFTLPTDAPKSFVRLKVTVAP